MAVWYTCCCLCKATAQCVSDLQIAGLLASFVTSCMITISRLCSQNASPSASLHLQAVLCVLWLSVSLKDCLLFQVASVVLVMRGRADGAVSPKPLQPVLLVMPLQVRLNNTGWLASCCFYVNSKLAKLRTTCWF